jgi:hypothetical protein
MSYKTCRGDDSVFSSQCQIESSHFSVNREITLQLISSTRLCSQLVYACTKWTVCCILDGILGDASAAVATAGSIARCDESVRVERNVAVGSISKDKNAARFCPTCFLLPRNKIRRTLRPLVISSSSHTSSTNIFTLLRRSIPCRFCESLDSQFRRDCCSEDLDHRP